MARKNCIPIQAWFNDEEYDLVQDWRRAQRRIPPLSEALRELVFRGLAPNTSSEERDHRKVRKAS
jgi:hypothetical protein